MNTPKKLLAEYDANITEFDTCALGTTVKNLREKRNITQAQLAEKAQISAAEISKLEHGGRVKIPIETLIKISPHLNVSIDYLLASCVPIRRTDREHYFDYSGNEINLPDISRHIYSVDSELLLLISSAGFLEDTEIIHFVKCVIRLHMSAKQAKQSYIKKLYNDFKSYCFIFFETLLGMNSNKKDLP